MNKKLRSYMNIECQASVGIEATLLSPLVFITFLFILYFFFMCITYVSYNNLANTIAQDLNMRQTGYENVKKAYPNMPNIVVNNLNNGNSTGGSIKLKSSDIIVDDSESGVLRSAVYYSLDKNYERLCIPFSQITGVKVSTAKKIKPSDGNKMAGNVIEVTVKYKSYLNINLNGIFGIQGSFFSMPTMNAVGYNVIS